MSPTPRGAPSRSLGADGIALPMVLLLLLALGAVAMTALVVARTELLLERGNLHYLERRVRAEAALSAPFEAGTAEPGGFPELPAGAIPLVGGFVLRRDARAGGATPHAVDFLFLPDSIAAGFPGALEVGRLPVPGGLSRGDGECDDAEGGWRPLTRIRTPEVPADPPVPPPPRLGPLGVADLLDLSDAGLGATGDLSGLAGPAVVGVAAGARLGGGAGSGVLVGAGDLTLAGDARFRGLVVVVGDLHLTDSALLEGVALVGGLVTTTGASRIVGCRSAAAAAMRATLPVRPYPIAAGRLIGSY